MTSKVNRSLAVFVSLSLAACNSSNTLSLETTGSIQAPQPMANLAITHPIANYQALIGFSEEFPKVLTAQQRLFKNGIFQQIKLENNTTLKGENYIELRALEGANQRKIEQTISLHSNDEQTLYREFSKQFPGQKFRVLNQALQNRYGLYGLSVFKANSKVSCMFAWQKLDARQQNSRLLSVGSNNGNQQSRGDISYNVRYCATGLNEKTAQKIMQQVVIKNQQSGYYSQPQENLFVSSSPDYAEISEPIVKRKAIKPKARKKVVKKAETAYSDFPIVPLPE